MSNILLFIYLKDSEKLVGGKTIPHGNTTSLLETQIFICSKEMLNLIGKTHKNIDQFIDNIICDSKHMILADILPLKFGSHFSLITDMNSYFNECMRLLIRVDISSIEKSLYFQDPERLNVYRNRLANISKKCLLKKNVFIEIGCKIGKQLSATLNI